MDFLEPETFIGLIVVLVVIVLVILSTYATHLWSSLRENIPEYNSDILGQEAIAHEAINPRGFIYYEDTVYPARAVDKYIPKGDRVIIIAYEKDILIVRPKTSMDEHPDAT